MLKVIEMKKQLHTFIMGLLALFSIYLYYLSAEPILPTVTIKKNTLINVNNEEQKALNYLNHLRQGAGLVSFISQKQLKIAAKNHAKYLTDHSLYGHKESSKIQGFTGEFASSRIVHAGYASPQVIENVSTLNHNYKESIDGLFAAIYHRLAFLDFRSDAIGIGISQNKQKTNQTAFVYDMSSNALEKLYASKETITNERLTKALMTNKRLNSEVVIYPFNRQKNVPPAFFDELPDPLPEHKVSGFPISISFNNHFHKTAKLKSFQLFNNEGKEITETIVFDKKSDPNKRLKKLDFVLFPLKRLNWNTQYYVKFLAIVDNKIFEKKWSFHTEKFKIPLHTVNKEGQLFKMKLAEAHIFYFPPTSKVDLLNDISYPNNLDVEFIDKNTIKIIALKKVDELISLNVGRHTFNVQITR